MSNVLIVGGIVHHDQKYILLDKNAKGKYILPKIKISVGLDSASEIKDEIEKEYLIPIRLEKVLPDAWSSLLMLHSGAEKNFRTYYIFKTLDFEKSDDFWFEINSIGDLQFEKPDQAALDYFLGD